VDSEGLSCYFDKEVVQATFVSSKKLLCLSPALEKGTYQIQISSNEADFVEAPLPLHVYIPTGSKTKKKTGYTAAKKTPTVGNDGGQADVGSKKTTKLKSGNHTAINDEQIIGNKSAKQTPIDDRGDGKDGKYGVASKKSTLKMSGNHATTNDEDGDKQSIGGDKSAKKTATDNDGKKATVLKPEIRKATNDENGDKEDTDYKSAKQTVTDENDGLEGEVNKVGKKTTQKRSAKKTATDNEDGAISGSKHTAAIDTGAKDNGEEMAKNSPENTKGKKTDALKESNAATITSPNETSDKHPENPHAQDHGIPSYYESVTNATKTTPQITETTKLKTPTNSATQVKTRKNKETKLKTPTNSATQVKTRKNKKIKNSLNKIRASTEE